MRRDVAAAPAAAVASPPIAAETGRGREAPAEVAIDVDGVPAGAAAHGVACRICHLGPEGGDGPAAAGWSEVIRLGCGCKGELGDAHRHCAEAWFRIKGDRLGAQRNTVQTAELPGSCHLVNGNDLEVL